MFKFIIILFGVFKMGCHTNESNITNQHRSSLKIKDTSFFGKLSDAAISLTKQKVTYDPAYFSIAYPNGDVPANKGVCCDVVIRAYRKTGIDLQRKVHEDMAANFKQYPRKWGLNSTDKNIDHRRVPNLMKYFERHNAALPITQHAADYNGGDIVCWMLQNNLTHIGIVIDISIPHEKRNLIVHNIGSWQVFGDYLFKYKIIGHYRYKE